MRFGTISMSDKAAISELERQRRLLKALSRCRGAASGGILDRLLQRGRRRALLARLEAEWRAGFVLHATGDLVFVPTPLDARGCHCLLHAPAAHPAALAVLAPGAVAIDIGASLGEWAVPLARAVGPSGRLFAFEPQPLAARALAQTFRINHFVQAEAIEAAVSDRGGMQEMAMPAIASRAVDSGRARIGAAGAGETASPVRSVAIDAFAGEVGLTRLDLIKIDVEGHERAVLAGACNTLARFRPAIVMETGHESAADRAAIEALLRGAGYALTGVLLDHGVVPASWPAYAVAAAPCLPGEVHNLLLLPSTLAYRESNGGR
jgi:FkbM family methyltransferase